MSDMRVGAARGTFAAPEPGTTVKSGSLSGPPAFPVEGLGYAGLLAQLVTESSHENAKRARELVANEASEQSAALERQVGELMNKADDTRAEGLLSGGLTIAGGAVTVASVGFAPSAADEAKSAEWQQAAADYKGAASAGAFASVAKSCAQQIKTLQATSDAVRTMGSTLTQAGPQISHGIYGARQTIHDANSTRAAADGKLHESAKEQYDALAKEAHDIADKVNQFVQSVVAEKQATMRAILKMA